MSHIKTNLMAASVGNISTDLLDKLNKTFTKITAVPNVTTLEDVMYNAGQLEVVEWINHHATKSIITGGPLDPKNRS